MPNGYNVPADISEARPYRVLCNYMLRDSSWSVHFVVGQEAVGRWFHYREPGKVLDILRTGGASEEAITQALLDMKRWGRGSTRIDLTAAQWEKLRAG
jgi:hypothetical protein